MERSGANLLFGVHSVGIAAYLGFCLLDGGSHLGVCRLAVEIFQLDYVGVLHIVVYLLARTEEDVGIAVLIVNNRQLKEIIFQIAVLLLAIAVQENTRLELGDGTAGGAGDD